MQKLMSPGEARVHCLNKPGGVGGLLVYLLAHVPQLLHPRLQLLDQLLVPLLDHDSLVRGVLLGGGPAFCVHRQRPAKLAAEKQLAVVHFVAPTRISLLLRRRQNQRQGWPHFRWQPHCCWQPQRLRRRWGWHRHCSCRRLLDGFMRQEPCERRLCIAGPGHCALAAYRGCCRRGRGSGGCSRCSARGSRCGGGSPARSASAGASTANRGADLGVVLKIRNGDQHP
mmetsp:Transcript_33532/g.90760  ORF Transcript_33532/g.90760 Transcript_33532/m.90760 type:complete len:226 (-) Transcript_33532:53-730(-)